MPDLAPPLSFKQRLLFRVIPLLIWAGASLIARSVRLQHLGDEELRSREAAHLPSLVVSWHGRTFLPIWLYGRRHWAAMISLSRDGEYQARIFQRFGWQVIRGSSGRGGVRALVGAVRLLQEGATLAFTPDGPKGPLHTIHPGVLYLSQKTGCPIYPVGVSAWPRWTLPTWDHYLVPRPFSRGRVLYGSPLTVPAAATAEDLEEYAAELARRINAIEAEAEAAAQGKEFTGS